MLVLHTVRGSGLLARLAAALCVASLAASCGGGVSGPPAVNDPNRITILPSAATLYSGLPTTFQISGGTGSYIVSSSNQAVLPVEATAPLGALTVVPNAVIADTAVTLTVRDTGTTPVVTAELTIRPGTVNNDITIEPAGTQGGDCSPAVCSGGDALVTATVSQGGNPLPGRGVRFEAVSGNFLFITSAAGAAIETLASSVTVTSDEAGKAQARLRAAAGAANQTALLQVTDLGSGAFRRAGFTIAQATGSSPGFFATPQAIEFSGPNDQACASTGTADVFVYGGTPPYNVGSAGSAFIVSRNVLTTSGTSFGVTPTGTCVAPPGLPITVTDAAGRSTAVTVANVLGTTSIPPVVAAPQAVTLSECQTFASVSLAGGTGAYVVSSGSGAIAATMSGANTLTIRRNPNTAATTPVSVGVSSGGSVATITVNITGAALGTCDGSAFAVTPTTVTLAGCSEVQVAVSGNTGAYSLLSNNSSVRASPNAATYDPNNNNFYVERVPGSPSFEPPATVFVTWGNFTRAVTVNATGAGLGSCPFRP